MNWLDKRYYTLNGFFQNIFSQKVVKIPLDAGFTCPNRDGTLSDRGCIFCSDKGSGDFAGDREKTITEQFEDIKKSSKEKWPNAKYIPYFQAYTNTYAPIETLKEKYNEALNLKDVVAISIATRPDCLPPEVLKLLSKMSKKTFLIVEMGLQTANEQTGTFINRCYTNKDFINSVSNLHKIGAHVVAHVILGLPGENKEDMLKTMDFLNKSGIDGVKLQLMYIIRNTEMELLYKNGRYKPLTYEQYIDIVVSCIERLSKNVVIHRITGDADRNQLIAPDFLIKKWHILNGIDKEFINRDSFQGKYF